MARKHIILYFWNLASDFPPPHVSGISHQEDIKEIFNKFSPILEVVFVAFGNNKKVFEEAFSAMPWLAIPHENQEGRDLIKRKFVIEECRYPESVLFDVKGTVLIDEGSPGYFREYGPEGFPFTKNRFLEIASCDDLKWQKLISSTSPPWKELIGDFVLSHDDKLVSKSN